jgi:putative aldouronate transport system permease protein
MLPGLGYFLLFHYGAMAGNVIAFKDYVPFDGLWASQWIGLENFQRMFEDTDFWASVVNTLWIALLQLTFYFPVPLALAMLLQSVSDELRFPVSASVVGSG